MKHLLHILLMGLCTTHPLWANNDEGILHHTNKMAAEKSAMPLDFNYTFSDTVTALKQIPQLFINTKPNLVERAEVLRPFYQKIMNQKEQVRVLHLGDSHVAGRDFPNAVKSVLTSVWNTTTNDSSTQKVVYEYMAKNGATMGRYLSGENLSKIAEKRPDLIIISFGTNECHDLKYDEDAHRRKIVNAFDSLKMACPQATFLFTTPPGAYLKYRPNPMSARCASLLKKFAAEYNAAYWDLYEIAGGERALQNYIAAGMLKKDRVHFTSEGYKLQGTLLGQALLTAFPKTTN